MTEYWRSTLDAKEEACYLKMLQSFRQGIYQVNCGDLDADRLAAVYIGICYDHPELFSLSHAPKVGKRQAGFFGFGALSTTYEFITESIYSPQQIRTFQKRIEDIVKDLQQKVRFLATEQEKIITVAETVVMLTTYEINDRFHQNAAAALCNGKAQCSGIAKAVKLLLDRLGIYCLVLDGHMWDAAGKGGPHAWNIVKLGGSYYHLDVTSMLGANMNKTLPLTKYALFYDDRKIAENHQWDRSKVPSCTDSDKAINEIEEWQEQARQAEEQSEIDKKKFPHFTTLNALRQELSRVLTAREREVSFYLDVNLKTQKDVNNAVSNACRMVAQKEFVSCSAEIAVMGDLRVLLKFDYSG